MKLYKPLESSVGMCPNKLICWCASRSMSIREINNFNPPVAFLKPRNEGIAEFNRLLASELLKGLSFKCVRREKYHPENRSNPPFCFALRSGKKTLSTTPKCAYQIFAPAIFGSGAISQVFCNVRGITKKSYHKLVNIFRQPSIKLIHLHSWAKNCWAATFINKVYK